jgi:hypothetical protein
METTINFTFTVQELTLPSGCIIEDAEFETSGRVVDNGIGAYEFWGATGNDVRYEYEADEIQYLGETNQEEVDQYINSNWDTLNDIAHEDAYSNNFYYD